MLLSFHRHIPGIMSFCEIRRGQRSLVRRFNCYFICSIIQKRKRSPYTHTNSESSYSAWKNGLRNILDKAHWTLRMLQGRSTRVCRRGDHKRYCKRARRDLKAGGPSSCVLATLVTESEKTSGWQHMENPKETSTGSSLWPHEDSSCGWGHAKGWTAVAPTWCWESSSSGQHIFLLAHTEPMHRW